MPANRVDIHRQNTFENKSRNIKKAVFCHPCCQTATICTESDCVQGDGHDYNSGGKAKKGEWGSTVHSHS
jgi:hypothetical protein